MINKQETLPILYSLRNCPYAIRARMALYLANQSVQLREIRLNNKPAEMLLIGESSSVPLLVLDNGNKVTESFDIMLWAFNQLAHTTYLLMDNQLQHQHMLELINKFDQQFKPLLEKYRCSKRYHEPSITADRAKCQQYIEILEDKLNDQEYLIADHATLADIAIFPFIRQFAQVERQWYLAAPYPKLRQWLNRYLQSTMFVKVMKQHPEWTINQEIIIYPSS